MAELMAKTDLAICAGGASVWELFCMGVPSVCICTANNQKQQIFDLQHAGLVISAEEAQDVDGFIRHSLDKAHSDSDLLRVISEKIYEMVDGFGASKVCNLIVAPTIKMRLAEDSDSMRIFTWRNHPRVRSNSRSTDEVSWPDHERWFDQRSGKVNQPILIGEVKGEPIGVVRFDISDGVAEVSIYLVPDSGKSGLGRGLLSQAERWLRKHHPNLTAIRARVLSQNIPSRKLFQSLQYVPQNDTSQIEFVKIYE